MTQAHIPGYPRIGAGRALKTALEGYWNGTLPAESLVAAAQQLRLAHWEKQAATLGCLTVGDFSLYDHVLDHALLWGAVPARFGVEGEPGLAEYFALARGNAHQPALEMTKWFDTNYHYLVPELSPHQAFSLHPQALLAQVEEARRFGRPLKVVLLGPVSFLYLSKAPGGDRLQGLDSLVRCYDALLALLAQHQVEWVQMDEPILAFELAPHWQAAFERAYGALGKHRPPVLLTTYFGDVSHHIDLITRLPVEGVHLDLVRAPQQQAAWLEALPAHWVLSAGIVDGRNVWRLPLDTACRQLQGLRDKLGERLWIATSCSLLHVPVTLAEETGLDAELRTWLAFADEKLEELRVLAAALTQGPEAESAAFAAARQALLSRRLSPRVHDRAVKDRLLTLPQTGTRRPRPFAERRALQQARLQLPLLPTTTIGSFPQTTEIRAQRAAFRRGTLTAEAYQAAIRAEVARTVREQEVLGLDVLVHGEAERNDMVEFFGEQLKGYAFTREGWVQSYGSRCVKPPVIFGDVSRPHPMTVDMARYAQSLTSRPMKGMLTGPVTLLQWSFVRDDQPRETTALQLALAVRDEVMDLQAAGIAIIQIDEPALREGLPLAQGAWAEYLGWAVRAFQLSVSGVRDDTQIHTHMCYAEFNDILPAIAAMDADVITIETSRSQMALLEAFGTFAYPNDIGPGVYDIHAPRIPAASEMDTLMQRALAVIPAERLWVNPDCGLKTRRWEEVRPALARLVETARGLRVALQEETQDIV